LYIMFFYVLWHVSLGEFVLLPRKEKDEAKLAIIKDKKKRFYKILWLFFLFILSSMMVWKWYLLDDGSFMKTANEKYMVNSEGDLLVDAYEEGLYSMWFFDENNDGIYDAVRHDVNGDGIIDLVYSDRLWVGEMAETIYDGEEERNILLVFWSGVLFVLIAYLLFRRRKSHWVDVTNTLIFIVFVTNIFLSPSMFLSADNSGGDTRAAFCTDPNAIKDDLWMAYCGGGYGGDSTEDVVDNTTVDTTDDVVDDITVDAFASYCSNSNPVKDANWKAYCLGGGIKEDTNQWNENNDWNNTDTNVNEDTKVNNDWNNTSTDDNSNQTIDNDGWENLNTDDLIKKWEDQQLTDQELDDILNDTSDDIIDTSKNEIDINILKDIAAEAGIDSLPPPKSLREIISTTDVDSMSKYEKKQLDDLDKDLWWWKSFSWFNKTIIEEVWKFAFKKEFQKILSTNGAQSVELAKKIDYFDAKVKYLMKKNDLDKYSKSIKSSQKGSKWFKYFQQKNVKERNNKISKYVWKKNKVGKVVKVLWAAADVLWAYNDYNEFNKEFHGDSEKAVTATMTQTVVGKIVWSNPVDLTVGLVSAGMSIFGFDDAAKAVGEFQASSISKNMIKHSFWTTNAEFSEVINIQYENFKNSEGFVDGTKTAIAWTVTTGYTMAVAVSKPVLEVGSKVVGGLCNGVKSAASAVWSLF